MADGYWCRQHQMHPSAGLFKRPRPEYDLSPSGLPSAHDMRNYLARDDDRLGPQVVKDTKSIGSEYDRYLQNAQFSPFPGGEGSMYSEVGLGRTGGGSMPAGGGRPTYSLADPSMARSGDVRWDLVPDVKHPIDAIARSGSEILPLPPDTSSTLYIEGLPPNSTRREVAHIFRPFVGYKEVRLVTKESKHVSLQATANVRFLILKTELHTAPHCPCMRFLPVAMRLRSFFFFPIFYSPLPLTVRLGFFVCLSQVIGNNMWVTSVYYTKILYPCFAGGDPLILCFVDFVSPAYAATAMSAIQGYEMDEHDHDSAYLRLQFSKHPGPRSGSGHRGRR